MAQFFSLVKPTGVPVTVAETLKKSAQLDALLAAPLPNSGGTKMPIATSLADRVRRIRDGHDRRLAASEKRLSMRLDDIDRRSEEAVGKLDAKLEADAAAQEAQVRALEDEVNQLTNGGPA